MSDYTSASSYCNAFEAALDQVSGMLQPNSILTQTAAEGILQAFMLSNVTNTYKPLIAQLRENWTSTNTDLAKACLSIQRYDFATKDQTSIGVDTNDNTKALYTKKAAQAPKGTCDFDECVKAGITSHPKDKCWRKHPNLRPKISFGRMRTKNTGPKSNNGTTISEVKTEKSDTIAKPPDITS